MADGPDISAAMHWFTASYLAGVAMLPSTERGINKMAEREEWQRRSRQRGKGWEYSINSLPVSAQKELRRRLAVTAAKAVTESHHYQAGAAVGRRIGIGQAIDKATEHRARVAGMAKAAGLTGKAAERMNARLDLLVALDSFAAHHGLGITAAMDGFCAAYAAGDIGTDAMRNALGKDVSPSSLRRCQQHV